MTMVYFVILKSDNFMCEILFQMKMTSNESYA